MNVAITPNGTTKTRLATRWLAIFTAGVGITFLSACSGDASDNQASGGMGGGMPPAMVTIADVQLTNTTHYVTYPARARGAREVTIQAQVGGILQQRHYAEGEYVEQGQTLFQIDPEPYQLALNNAQAALATATANQAQAKREWQRVADLFANDAASGREYDAAQAAIEGANAALLQAQAAVQDSERNLRYTRVEAPISGIAEIESLSVGNLISTGTELTHLIQINPIHVHFAIPEHEAGLLRYHMQNSENGNHAKLTLASGDQYSEIGSINFVQTAVNPSTAQVALRAEFTNPEQQLLPGQFLRVTIALQQFSDVALIERTAVSQGQNGAQVYVIENGETAKARPVTLGPVINDKQVILSGLNNGDKLVVNGHVALQDGAAVVVTNNN
ncbi:efflux RND transporter periplasmic adaptor subunit [Aliidiomarina sp.]|uniref:efflux RND transporter periplasmic adaptor subunit n=1 Tax=Aliidiomarina sp. TaxID=1872439 RepID=UPI003A4DF61C